MKAKIHLHQLEFHAYHGVYAEEREYGQRFLVDLNFKCDIGEAAISDNLKDTIDYVLVYNLVAEEMKQANNLLEHLVVKIQNRLQKSFPAMEEVHVKVTKVNPPLEGKNGGFSVEI
jgi:dihydroneopterin aldolase